MLHAGRPELLAHEIIDLLDKTGAVYHATAISRASNGRCEVIAVTGKPPEPETAPVGPERQMAIGSARDCAIEIIIRPKDTIESVAALNAVKLLLATIHDIERARAEREERMTLWPIDDVTTDAGHAVVTGRMRELMSFAERIATTNVSVLITGESGTGKEILARAIHTYSARSQKPFIPFNCSAIPREMLESQLFGHRRGAFTGADRDNPGIIRSAREGTLFLDEIGDLGLDLQPKLLRFLESGEICPLGESTPFTVDVRVVAATNSNLEHGVKEGRFREDLFYRLNVIRLQIPPLRERRDEIPSLVNYFVLRAAEEFGKGQLRFAEETMEHLLLCPWPGNIRQLHNEIRRMAALAEPDAVLTPAALSDGIVERQTRTPHRLERPRARRPPQQQADADALENRARNDQSRPARTSRQGRRSRQGARHLAQGPVSEAPATRPLANRVHYFGSACFSRMSNPVVETRTSNSAGLVTGTKVPEPYSASSRGARNA